MTTTSAPIAAADSDRGRWTNVLSLARGTVLAQLVFILATPLLTRIYSAEQLGVFGVLAALVVVGSRFAGLRYELAIPLPKSEDLATHLIVLAVGASVVLLALAWLGYQLLVFAGTIPTDAHPLQDYVHLVVVSTALFVLNEAQVFWFIRRRRFALIANARVINAVSLAILQLLAVFATDRLSVLLSAYPLALALSVAYLFSRTVQADAWRLRFRLRRLRALAVRYREFPIYTTWSTAAFELSQALPLFVLSGAFGSAQAGYFFLARRIGLVPTSVIGRAITQVNHGEMVERYRDGTLAGPLTRQMHLLQWISVVPAVVLGLAAPMLCAWLLGDAWRTAGHYLLFMAPYVLVRFVFAPIGAINFVAEWQRLGFWFEIVATALSTGVLMLFATRGQPEYSVAAYFAVQCVANLVYRLYLLHRLDIHPLRVVWPGLLQLAVLAVVVPGLFAWFDVALPISVAAGGP